MRLITLASNHPAELICLKEALSLPEMWVHIRKPSISNKEQDSYLCAFSDAEKERIVVHQKQDIAIDNGLINLHLKSTERERIKFYPQVKTGYLRLSTSTHSWTEFNELNSLFEAAFISPIYRSISKPGYGLKEQLALGMERQNKETKLIALGGLNAQRLTELKNKGFDDYALCGAIWEASNPLTEIIRCYKIIHSSSV